jgi:Protein of unknown function (DUF4238)
MRNNRKQHWLPACYLKNWTSSLDRDGVLFAANPITDSICRKTTPHKECTGANFYGKFTTQTDPMNFFEMRYSNLVDLLIKYDVWEIPMKVRFNMFVFMAHFNLRNAAIDLAGPEESRADNFQRNLDYFMLKTSGLTQETISRPTHMWKQTWNLRIMKTPNGIGILTSDNPCAFWSTRPNDCQLITLPITPGRVAIAYKRNVFKFIYSAKELDVKSTESIQATTLQARNRHVYGHLDFSAKINPVMAHQTPVRATTSLFSDAVQFIWTPYNNDFSFLRLR